MLSAEFTAEFTETKNFSQKYNEIRFFLVIQKKKEKRKKKKKRLLKEIKREINMV